MIRLIRRVIRFVRSLGQQIGVQIGVWARRIATVRGRPIARSLKLAYSAYLAALIPAYCRAYGPSNFLWFSDVALLCALGALWWEHALLASMPAVGVIPIELLWNAEFASRLAGGPRLLGLTDYMFDRDLTLYIRGLSLFHVWLPLLLLWLVARLGYDRRAWAGWTLLTWCLVPATYAWTDPAKNINWVHGFGTAERQWIPSRLHASVMMIVLPLVVFRPAHVTLRHLFPEPAV
jgi:hypothetical protein